MGCTGQRPIIDAIGEYSCGGSSCGRYNSSIPVPLDTADQSGPTGDQDVHARMSALSCTAERASPEAREHFGMLESTEVSSVPTEHVDARTGVEVPPVTPIQRLKTIFSGIRTALWCTWLFLRSTSPYSFMAKSFLNL